MSRPRRRATLVVAVALTAAATVVVAVARTGSNPAGGNRDGASLSNSERFLRLTGSDPASAAALLRQGRPVTTAASGGDRPQCGSSPTTPAGWCLTPAGTQYDVLRFPIGLAVDPSGRAVVSSDSGGTQALAVINPAAADPTSAVTFSPGANLFLGLSIASGGEVYASGGNADRVFRYQIAGPAAVPEDATQAAEFPTHNLTNGLQSRANAGHVQAAPVGDGIYVGGYPGESLLDQRHNLLFVGGTLSEATGAATEHCLGSMADGSAVPACARVTVVDTTRQNTGSDPVVARVAVGADTYGLALDSRHGKLFVANWGDQASRGNGQGTVSVLPLNPQTGMPGTESAVIPVGHHPEAVALSPDQAHVYVTDTNDDTVTVIDTATNSVVGTINVGTAGHQIGTQPDALAVSPDGATLFVALAGINALQVIPLDPATGLNADSTVSYIPTGWYPSAVAAVPGPGHSGTRLWVANAKGVGFGPGANGSVLFQGTTTGGTVNLIDYKPASKGDPRLRDWTSQVIANDGLDENADPCAPALNPSPVLCPAGTAPLASNPSPIKHVVYIVAENKTFDSYFGDVNPPGSSPYDADPAFTLFGQPATTNQHKMVAGGVGVLGDNFYSDAEVSVTGHSYTSGALATDHNEKTWPADYDQGVRGTHGNGDPLRPSVGTQNQTSAIGGVESALNDPQGGYLFERFVQAGAVDPATKEANPADPLSMAIYGEHTTAAVGPQFQAKGGSTRWKDGDIQYFDSCRALLFIHGTVGGGNTPDTDFTRDCENRTLDSQFSLAHWESLYAAKGDLMPNLIYMSLPDNHTLGTNLGSPTPQSMVADNDYAIGLIVQALSQSPFWSSTAVVIVQDDTQATGDHVSPLRDPLEVIGPWAAVSPDHQRGSMGAVLRTIELLFGVTPVGINDNLAAPLHGAFVAKLGQVHDCHTSSDSLRADGTYAAACYTAVRPLVPFALNQVGAPGQADSMAMDWSQVDHMDMATLNAIWLATQRHLPYRRPTTTFDR